jgi:hypothetical protein
MTKCGRLPAILVSGFLRVEQAICRSFRRSMHTVTNEVDVVQLRIIAGLLSISAWLRGSKIKERRNFAAPEEEAEVGNRLVLLFLRIPDSEPIRTSSLGS